MQQYTFKQLQEKIKFNSDFSMDKPLFVRFPTNVKATMNKVEYNGSDCLVGQMKHNLLIQGSRKPTEAITVELVHQDEQGNMQVVAEGFINPSNIWFQSARQDETRVSVPPWYGNEKAYASSIALAKQVEDMIEALADKHNISKEQAREMLTVAKAEL